MTLALKVALVQLASGSDKPANLAALRSAVAEAADAGARLVVCPEAAMHGFGRPGDPLAPVAEPLDGRFVTGLAEAAAAHEVTVVAGMFETVPDDASRAYNTLVALGPSGQLLGRYRKLHLFDALGWRESERFARADVAAPDALLTFGCAGFTVGTLTCYDLRFPEIARALADAGAELLALPAAWVAGPLKEDQWVTLVRARAIENTCYVAAAAQPAAGYCGRSMVVDPAGVPVVQLTDVPGLAVADVGPERLAEVRAQVPALEHRRFSVTPAG